jgi:hypothetical protein
MNLKPYERIALLQDHAKLLLEGKSWHLVSILFCQRAIPEFFDSSVVALKELHDFEAKMKYYSMYHCHK